MRIKHQDLRGQTLKRIDKIHKNCIIKNKRKKKLSNGKTVHFATLERNTKDENKNNTHLKIGKNGSL
jgi:hypothetical protein